MPKSLNEYLLENPPAPGMGDVRLADREEDAPEPPAPGVMGDVRLADRALDAVPAKAGKNAPRVQVGSVDLAAKADNGFLKGAVTAPSPATMQAASAQKPGPGDPDADLLAAQNAGNHHADVMGALGIINQGLSTFAGVPQSNWFAEQAAGAKHNVADLIQRRDQARKAVEDREHTESLDPNSDISRRATALARAQGLIGPSETITAAEFANARAGAGIQAQREAAAANNALANAQFGYQRQHDAAQMSQQAREAQAQREFQMALHASDKDADLRKALLEAEAKKAEKAGTAPGALVAPGFVRGEIPFKEEEAAKFRDALAAKNKLAQSAKEMMELYTGKDATGKAVVDAQGNPIGAAGTELFGKTKAKYDAIRSNMELELKNLAQLGALSGSDLDLMRGQIPDPTGLAAGVFGTDNTPTKLEQFQKTLDNSIGAKAEAMGLRHTGGAPAAPAKPVVRKQVNRKLGKTRLFYADGTSEEVDGIQ